jgi:hypothetical protein
VPSGAGTSRSRASDHSEASEIARSLGGDADVWEMLKVELYA